MSNHRKIFSEEVELSEIVLKKTNQAFARIKQEDTGYMKRTTTEGRKLFKTQAAVMAGVCVLAISSVSAAAAIHHYWGRGMKGNIQASDIQQQVLTEKKIAIVYNEEPDASMLAVTDSGITIKPDTMVVDDRFAYMTFNISGYHVAEGMEPGFETVDVYQGDNPEDENAWVNMSGSMYDGIIPNENGIPVYEDGTAIGFDEEGKTICHYTDENGNMEYIIQASIANENDSFLGKIMHVNFKNLGTLYKAEFTPAVEGNWNFNITLPNVSSAQDIWVNQKIAGTDFTMESVNISPISMKVNYSVGTAPAENEDNLDIPQVAGVVLKDGTRLPYLTDGGGVGYTDDSKRNAYHIAGYDRVIDVDAVAALIVWTFCENEMVEIPISQ